MQDAWWSVVSFMNSISICFELHLGWAQQIYVSHDSKHIEYCTWIINEFLKRHSMLCLTGSVLWCWWDLTNHWSVLLCPCVQVLTNSSNALALAAFSSAVEIQIHTKWNAMQLCPHNHWRVGIWGFIIFSFHNFTLDIFTLEVKELPKAPMVWGGRGRKCKQQK